MPIIDVSELDFDAIKTSIKNSLKSQTTFQDYDFEGSGLSVLLNILAYNTVYNAYFQNMAAGEAFLDSSVLRDSVVSHAKMLGYSVRSPRAATATIDLTIIPTDSPVSILIPKGTKFESEIDGKTYTFTTNETTTVYESSDYIAEDLEIVEGTRLTHTFTVDSDWTDQRFILPNAGIDTSLMTVKVQNSATDLGYATFVLAQDYTTVEADSNVYFVQETNDGKFEIYFGDGVVGTKPVDGNLIIVEYVVCNGTLPNGAAEFVLSGGISGYTTVSIVVVSSASGGSDVESIESIKYLAPLNYVTQNRAVTKTDYENLLLRDFPNIDSVKVWGGEDNDPPQYGKVFVCINPQTGTVLSAITKQNLVDQILGTRNMVSIEVEIVDPDYIYLVIDSEVKYRSSLSNLSAGDLISAITDEIIQYGEDNLEKFGSYFRYSRFINLIDEADDSIQNNLTSITLMYRLYPSFTIPTNYTISFNNEIDSAFDETGNSTLSSTAFVYNSQNCYFDDDGAGIVRIYRLTNGVKNVVVSSAGTIDYVNGVISLNSFLPVSITSGDEYIELYVRPTSNDVEAQRNYLLMISEENINIELTDEDGR